MVDKNREGKTPRVFVSYCWSSPDHQAWVLDLCTEMRTNGVDVVFDKWDLKEGNDKYVFMEKMVTDPSIDKVLIISDKKYAEKADNREGGVGTETQIISPEIFEKENQDKFVVAVVENHEDGSACLPTYYRSRKYIDFTTTQDYTSKYEQLLRWIFEKPLHKKPPIGDPPNFISDEVVPTLKTQHTLKRSIEAMENGGQNAIGATRDYFDKFISNLGEFRILPENGTNDELIYKSIEDLLPYRNEFIVVLKKMCRFLPTPDISELLRKFFEGLLSYYVIPPSGSYDNPCADNFKFLNQELFLYALAILLDEGKTDGVSKLLNENYYTPPELLGGKGDLSSYGIFRRHLRSMDIRKQRLKSNKLSLTADLLKNRSTGSGYKFDTLMQSDFLVWIHGNLNYHSWHPDTLIFAGRYFHSFELFTRARSKIFFEKTLCPILGISGKEDLDHLAQKIKAGEISLSYSIFDSVDPITLMGYEDIGRYP